MTITTGAPATATDAQAVAAKRRRRLASGRDAGPLVYLSLSVIVLVSIFPLYYILVTATRTNAEMNTRNPPLTPGSNLIGNIASAMEQANIPLALFNSAWVSALVALGAVLTSTMAGFALSHLGMKHEGTWLGAVMGTMMVPLQLGVIPLFIFMAAVNLVGNPMSVVLPYLTAAFGVFFMRQYLAQAMPKSLLEAARVDGASTRRIFWRIVLPIASPGMAVLAMLTFMQAWNEFFWPIIALNPSNPTVQVAISQLGQGYVHDQSVIMAGIFVCTMPVIIAFILLGKRITSGIVEGAVK
ncbi:carbohydrate ABC transporter permease [Tessaracoccus palaemonis]|uniref:Carbohydrate ABC transporter permease n=1 Tax=Tessaracoccus palaemonis TaxID=2829499 RepID=A0ABX8SM56_9ACTN|nr:carbohydrate ABC transporter permease [Tessaracoccus palaemonis]QXT63715.1 carbohydrate ABC transporter permease [Tessaracoccus palaemonis]